MARLDRGIRYDLWVVFAVVCGMLLHAPSMSAHAQGPAIHAAASPHANHHGPGPLDVAGDEDCCAICSPAGCGLGPVPDASLPSRATVIQPMAWTARMDFAIAEPDHYWPAPRGPPLPG